MITCQVSNLLHHLSLRRGIQVLRQNGFSPSCLKRRASPEEKERNSLPIEVSLWSNHRVMEWLRHVDLAEYAPNLRGSGVHGGLLIYEPRFTADLFASLLSIPANKTLLRRHLGLHFRYAKLWLESLESDLIYVSIDASAIWWAARSWRKSGRRRTSPTLRRSRRPPK